MQFTIEIYGKRIGEQKKRIPFWAGNRLLDTPIILSIAQ